MKRRPVLASRKKPSQLTAAQSKSIKAPTLFDHTTKIQQKLLKLKQEVEQKKKQVFQKTKSQMQQIQIDSNTIKAKRIIRGSIQSSANQIEPNRQMSEFLKRIGMDSYEKLLSENGVDSMEVLREIKQKQLEQIGIAKGHALKIIINLKKEVSSRQKNHRNTLQSSQSTLKNAEKTNTFNQKKRQQLQGQKLISNKPKTSQPLQIIIKRQFSIGEQEVLPQRRYFCLYCYQVCDHEFCSQNCQELYNKMFEKYEKNLAKAQQLYGGKLQRVSMPEQQIDENQFVNDLAFLDLAQDDTGKDQFNEDAYMEAIGLIKMTNDQIRQEQRQHLAYNNPPLPQKLNNQKEERQEEA